MPAELVITLRGPGWRAALAVEPPRGAGRTATFTVPALGAESGRYRTVTARVRYTGAQNRLPDGWADWHVKLYRCDTAGDVDALRRHLRQQAVDLQRANADLEGPARIPIEPPWAVVPVQIIRGDGQQESLQDLQTELAAPVERVVERADSPLPAWFGDEQPAPELCLLAISPRMEELDWDGYRPSPGTEHLAEFVDLAAGLDAMHRVGLAHCDVKPANVCRYSRAGAAGYVLIDTDAAVRLHPAPTMLRTTEWYEYAGVAEWRALPAADRPAIDPGLLRAQDRFGFAIVVLTALAGRDWVDRILLQPDEEDNGARPADDRALVAAALRRLWPDRPDRHWAPLIEALVAPFSRAGTAPAIEAGGWSARAWLDRVRAAEAACVPRPAAGAAVPLPRADVGPYERHLARIRDRANAGRAVKRERIERVFHALRETAEELAVRAAVGRAAAWCGGLAALSLVITIGAVGMGK
ncbi:hypothetical protein GCM10010123_41330 [Pilimelia anulata]|uniref:Protein kinase domain-containing protein n=1 Tax=Pilimelia anulata TaxID=53371 RepID=A0A8J3FC32_9ACTN|nr:hypothetical protein [Pilimelia anulata]GGK07213.1 hypothetical protein GCM10010123_41330 [Pilimelia anulata]